VTTASNSQPERSHWKKEQKWFRPTRSRDAISTYCASMLQVKPGRALQLFANLKKICEEHLAGRYKIEIIDLLEKPQLAKGDQILALPTLVRHLPPPIKKIIGDLSNTEKVLVGLDLRPARQID
jgi:hypothetical protein